MRKETLVAAKVAVIYYSATGNVYRLARAVDQSGNVETRFTRRNRKEFRVKAETESAR